MTWEEKLVALQCLGDTCLIMRRPGDWFVSSRAEIKQGAILAREYGNGPTPQAAVEDHWRIFVDDLPPGQYIVTDAYRPERKAYRWTGYMWREVVESELGGGEGGAQ